MIKNLNSLDNDETSFGSNSDEEATQENTLSPMNNFQNITGENLFLMMKRTYYLNEMKKIESYLDSLEDFGEKNLLTNEQKKLSLCFNKLSNFESLYISLEDYYKSLNLQKRILNVLKSYIINKIG